jgi:hypothetical protein
LALAPFWYRFVIAATTVLRRDVLRCRAPLMMTWPWLSLSSDQHQSRVIAVVTVFYCDHGRYHHDFYHDHGFYCDHGFYYGSRCYIMSLSFAWGA